MILSDIIGKNEIAKLAVALTFFNDLHRNNWGIADNKLVLIDVDAMPNTFSAFLQTAVFNANHFMNKYVGHLTSTHLQEMIAIYKSMKFKPLPVVHESVDMQKELYHKLLSAYIEACEYALARVKLSENGLTAFMQELTRIDDEYRASKARHLGR